MNTDQARAIVGDRAIQGSSEDRLGFSNLADGIVQSLMRRASSDGLVVGIEGSWGSGKSSLLSLISEKISKLDDLNRPYFIKFQPWLIGKKEALIENLFKEISNAIDDIASDNGNYTPIIKSKARKVSESFTNFMSGLSKTGEVIEFIGATSEAVWKIGFGVAQAALG